MLREVTQNPNMCISVTSLLAGCSLHSLHKSMFCLHLEHCTQSCSFPPISGKTELEEGSGMANKYKGIEMEFQNSELKW